MASWNWTWEESPGKEREVLVEAREAATIAPLSPSPKPAAPRAGGAPPAGRPQGRKGPPRPPTGVGRSGGSGDGPEGPNYHRRRVGAVIALATLLVVVIALAVSGGGSSGAHKRQARVSTAAAAQSHTAAVASEPTPQAEGQAINRVLAYTPAVVEGGHKGNEVALTFDDGPGPYTPRVVATLNALHVHATFFAIGEMERYFSEGTRLELSSGDAVENHTETHPMLAAMSPHEQSEQMLNQMLRIELLGGPRPRLFRPPYGSFDATTFRELRKLHLLTILWSTDTSDFRLPGVQAIVHTALAGAHPGAIILMHDGGGDRTQTIAALPAIVRGLRARGLRPVTVPQLLVDDPPPPGQPIPTSLAGD
jgi:peptidoglycan/xylan/chitin deacetylase (PgdA/CDA1 family)